VASQCLTSLGGNVPVTSQTVTKIGQEESNDDIAELFGTGRCVQHTWVCSAHVGVFTTRGCVQHIWVCSA